jgi:hypothetical protein
MIRFSSFRNQWNQETKNMNQEMQHAFELFAAVATKSKLAAVAFFKVAVATIIAYVAPAHDLLAGMGVLIFIDLVTGIYKVLRSQGFGALTAKGFRRTADKIVLFPIGIVAAYVLEIYWMPEMPVMRISTAWFAITETKSIFENLGSILGIDAWAAIWPRIKDYFDNIGKPKV